MVKINVTINKKKRISCHRLLRLCQNQFPLAGNACLQCQQLCPKVFFLPVLITATTIICTGYYCSVTCVKHAHKHQYGISVTALFLYHKNVYQHKIFKYYESQRINVKKEKTVISPPKVNVKKSFRIQRLQNYASVSSKTSNLASVTNGS